VSPPEVETTSPIEMQLLRVLAGALQQKGSDIVVSKEAMEAAPPNVVTYTDKEGNTVVTWPGKQV